MDPVRNPPRRSGPRARGVFLPVLLIVAAGLFSRPAAAATIHLKNGGVLYGDIQENRLDDVTVSIGGAGVVTISKRDILRVEGLEGGEAPATGKGPEKTDLSVKALLERGADKSLPFADRVKAIEEIAQRGLDEDRAKTVEALLAIVKELEEDKAGKTPVQKTPLAYAAFHVLSARGGAEDLELFLEASRGELRERPDPESGATRAMDFLAMLVQRAAGAEARDLLLKDLRDEDPHVRRLSAVGLLKLGDSVKAEELPDLFAETDPRTREALLDLAARVRGKEIGPAILKILSQGDADRGVYTRACTVAMETGGDAVVEALAAGLKTGNKEVAISGLLHLGWNAKKLNAKARDVVSRFNTTAIVWYDLPSLTFKNLYFFESGAVKILYGEVESGGGEGMKGLTLHAEFFGKALGIEEAGIEKIGPRSTAPFRIIRVESSPIEQVHVWFGKRKGAEK